MQKLLLLCGAIFYTTFLCAQAFNTTLLGTWHDPNLPTHSGLKYNDCWGYTAPDGREYAILGSAGKIHFIDITDPANPVEVANFGNLNINGTSSLSIWRDFKTYGQYAYAVADQSTTNEGLIVFDLSNLPTSVTKVHQTTAGFNRAHNVFIDEAAGRMYIPGSNTHGSGIIVYDLTANPAMPTEIASPNLVGGYSHDIYVRDNIAYCFHGGIKTMNVYDFTNASSPVFLGGLSNYLNDGYNHSGWLTQDSQYLIFCDETSGRQVKVADLSDLSDISAPSSWYFSSNVDAQSASSIAHNPFVKGNYVYVAYYRDGVQVWDVSNPQAAVLAGYYDTNLNTSAGVFDGAWGTFPFFNSGSVIASDTETGLYIINVNSILPVNLTSFSAIKQTKMSRLDWSTDFERNSDRFVVERSADGQEFSAIGEVKSQGNLNATQNYRFVDENPLGGTNYYRLKQVDLDGSIDYSDVRQVEFLPEMQIAVFPTLLKNGEQLNVNLTGLSTNDLTYTLTDISGKIMSHGSISRFAETHSIQLNKLSAGIYVFELTNGPQVFNQKVIVE